MEKKKIVAVILKEKDRDHLGLTNDLLEAEHKGIKFVEIRPEAGFDAHVKYDLIIHKSSDYIKGFRRGDKISREVYNNLVNNRSINRICLDSPQMVVDIANRFWMTKLIDGCRFRTESVNVVVPRWFPIYNKKDIEDLADKNLKFPLICKAMCGGDGEGAHAMQLIFNMKQLYELKIIPCIAQEFKNHNGEIVKIFVYGSEFFILTRPSIRNFPVNGRPIECIDSVVFDSHQVSKVSSKTFLNNFQTGFRFRSSLNGDKILDDDVVVEIIKRIQKRVNCSFLGIDLFVTNGGSEYNVFDVNYLPSYENVPDRFDLLMNVVENALSSNPVNYWCK